MKAALREQFERLSLRGAELESVLSDPSVASDMRRYRALLKEQAEVSAVLTRWARYRQREADLAAAQEFLAGDQAADPDLAAIARDGAQEAPSAPDPPSTQLHAPPCHNGPGRPLRKRQVGGEVDQGQLRRTQRGLKELRQVCRECKRPGEQGRPQQHAANPRPSAALAAVGHASAAESRMISRQDFELIQGLTLKPFTLDACCDDAGTNARCNTWCSPGNSFLHS